MSTCPGPCIDADGEENLELPHSSRSGGPGDWKGVLLRERLMGGARLSCVGSIIMEYLCGDSLRKGYPICSGFGRMAGSRAGLSEVMMLGSCMSLVGGVGM